MPGLKTRPPSVKTRPQLVLAHDPKTTVVTLLTAYDAGQYDIVDKALAAEPKAPLADALRSTGDQWIKTGPAAQLDRRRLVAAGLALEIVGAGLTAEWQDVHEVIEWACRHVRSATAGSPAELWWHLGSIALLQDGAGTATTGSFAPSHIARHAPERLPTSDRVRFGKAIEDERALRIGLRRFGGPVVTFAPASKEARTIIGSYTALASSPDVGDEASLRLGAFYLKLGATETALAVLAPISQSRDAYVAHVSSFLIGEVLRTLGRNADAAAAYRQALTRVPGGISASLGLSAVLIAMGDLDAAISATGPAASAAAPVDPWRSFALGEGRHWPRWRDNLRKALQQ